MSKMIEIEVSEELYDSLRRRAEREAMSIPDFLLAGAGVYRSSNPMSHEELLDFLRTAPRVDLGELTAADLIREGRDERGQQILDAIGRS